jgi:hypothetical protein
MKRKNLKDEKKMNFYSGGKRDLTISMTKKSINEKRSVQNTLCNEDFENSIEGSTNKANLPKNTSISKRKLTKRLITFI